LALPSAQKPLEEGAQPLAIVNEAIVAGIQEAGEFMHNLGKIMVIAMLRGAGFHVIDMGKDVPTKTFINKVKELKPDILGLGCYMTPTMAEIEKVIKYLEESGLRDSVKVMIGGVPTSQQYANESGADAWGKDALDAVEEAQRLMDGGKLK
jgi:methanogenic corrinoid protein MtbC1